MLMISRTWIRRALSWLEGRDRINRFIAVFSSWSLTTVVWKKWAFRVPVQGILHSIFEGTITHVGAKKLDSIFSSSISRRLAMKVLLPWYCLGDGFCHLAIFRYSKQPRTSKLDQLPISQLTQKIGGELLRICNTMCSVPLRPSAYAILFIIIRVHIPAIPGKIDMSYEWRIRRIWFSDEFPMFR